MKYQESTHYLVLFLFWLPLPQRSISTNCFQCWYAVRMLFYIRFWWQYQSNSVTSHTCKFRKITYGSLKKNTDYLVTLIKFPLTPTHHPPRMTYEKLLGVGKFTTHPPWRNNDIFLGFEEVFQQLNYTGISELLFF